MKVYEIQNSFGLENLKPTERADPVPGAREVLVQINAVSLNYRDLRMVDGRYNPRQPLPLIPCSDGAGVVLAVGQEVSRWKPGDRVISTFFQNWPEGEINHERSRSTLGGPLDGVLCQQRVFPEEGLVATPDYLSDEEASTFPCAGLTAWHALMEKSPLKPGETVLVQGTGGVSVFALQFAKMAGAQVIATSSSDEKLERVKAMGALEGINYRTEPDWDKRARELTANRGVDRIIEVGGPGTLERSLKAIRMGGEISLIGVLSGPGTIDPLPIFMKSVRMQGIFVGSRAMFEAMNRALEASQMRPVIDRVFPFEEAREAFDLMEKGGHFGKIVIKTG